MDKRKVVAAYRCGFITLQECAQILGLDSLQVKGIMEHPDLAGSGKSLNKQQTVSS
ncbi:hypothetical protein ACFOQM_20115 [Paenibacillus sp. GCM10012307]|uniref:Uncharacterized protein n=1 Tax=Paenibacillus roseus TaxID=2798579 RepID=A0A934JAM6_9BACL|nr:hypothetical protein [Paenibacillus roseus]MBJ6363532.1 hypothetical protein [Paenibacillus roseus]